MATSRDDFGIAIRSALLQRGARQKFSLFVLILISIAIFGLDNTEIKAVKSLRSLINDGVYRISAISSSPIKFTSATKDFFIRHVMVYEQNEKLRSEIEELKKQKFNNSYLQTQNKQLNDVVKLNKRLDFSTVGAKIILDKNSPYINSVIINKGTNSGIKLGMPVLSKGHLVGRIVEVNFISSRILLLNDLNSRIPVTFGGEGTQAILKGNGGSRPSLEYLPEGFVVQEGIEVFTSGKDGIFAPGSPVGITDETGQVKLFSESSQLSFVKIDVTKQSKGGF